jgi:hypothetical protein
VTQAIRDYVGLLLSSGYVTRSATAEHGLANFLFRGAYTPGMDSTTFKLMRLQGAKVYPKFEDVRPKMGSDGQMGKGPRGQPGQSVSPTASS